jgi:hypothetical protein
MKTAAKMAKGAAWWLRLRGCDFLLLFQVYQTGEIQMHLHFAFICVP